MPVSRSRKCADVEEPHISSRPKRFSGLFSLSRHGSKDNVDNDPNLLAVNQICKNLCERFTDIALPMTEDEVDEIGVQLLVVLEKFRAKSATGEQDRGSVVGRVSIVGRGSIIGRSSRVAPQRGTVTLTAAAGAAPFLSGQSPHKRNSFDHAVSHRMGAVVERHDGPMAVAQQLSLPSLASAHRKNDLWGMLMRATNGDGTHDVFLNFVDPKLRTPEMRADYLSFKVPLVCPYVANIQVSSKLHLPLFFSPLCLFY